MPSILLDRVTRGSKPNHPAELFETQIYAAWEAARFWPSLDLWYKCFRQRATTPTSGQQNRTEPWDKHMAVQNDFCKFSWFLKNKNHQDLCIKMSLIQTSTESTVINFINISTPSDPYKSFWNPYQVQVFQLGQHSEVTDQLLRSISAAKRMCHETPCCGTNRSTRSVASTGHGGGPILACCAAAFALSSFE